MIVMREFTGIVVVPVYVEPGSVVKVAVAVEPLPESVAVKNGPWPKYARADATPETTDAPPERAVDGVADDVNVVALLIAATYVPAGKAPRPALTVIGQPI